MPDFSEMNQKTGSGNEKSRWHLAGNVETAKKKKYFLPQPPGNKQDHNYNQMLE